MAYNLTILTFLPVELGIVDELVLILFKVNNARNDIDVLVDFFLYEWLYLCASVKTNYLIWLGPK